MLRRKYSTFTHSPAKAEDQRAEKDCVRPKKEIEQRKNSFHPKNPLLSRIFFKCFLEGLVGPVVVDWHIAIQNRNRESIMQLHQLQHFIFVPEICMFGGLSRRRGRPIIRSQNCVRFFVSIDHGGIRLLSGFTLRIVLEVLKDGVCLLRGLPATELLLVGHFSCFEVVFSFHVSHHLGQAVVFIE